jgi:hypothetical protein
MEVFEIIRLKMRVRKKWRDFWIRDEFDDTKKHLSQSDKRFILYGYFLTSTCLVAFVFLVIGFNNLWKDHQYVAAKEELLNIVTAYIESATKDEYDEIAKSIRHDLVFSQYREDIEKFIQYIPNTSDICRACEGSYPAQAVLVCLNNGESYPLDLYERGINKEDYEGNEILTFGYDEISQTSIHISKSPGENHGSAEIERGKGIVSIHRMKKAFCDDCIKAILDTVKKQAIEEVVIYDTEKNIFYPVEYGYKAQIGDYALETGYEDRRYEITVKSVSVAE